MRAWAALALAASLAATSAVGCYDQPQPPCTFLCGEADQCPGGYVCASDGWCKREDLSDEFVCEPEGADDAAAASDAAPADAAPADASL